ncbi:unnamed protein product [Oppiella nova]|uniref:TOM1-like protein 2 n=1 Tax=Oppiella nova TaxID=334625 RepID=A0A7R9L9S7_9ACAR|nr:unnamed protein product [Oppiella nova]CAG2160854.1 unnamed protein product [Oppiella nova]
MAELLQRFSGNPFTTTVGQKIEQATDPSLASENWALNMEICDVINDTDEGPRDAVRAIRKRLQQNSGKNFTVVMFTLTVLEACVKNCGKRFHLLVTNKDFVQELVKIIGPKNDPPAVVQEKVLSLIQSWAQAFRGQTELQGVVQVYNELKSKGIEFPATDSEAMAPIHTPQRAKSATSHSSEPSVPLPTNTSVGAAASVQPQPMTGAAARRVVTGPMQLSPEQLAKLRSELDVVQSNMKVFSEMLTELTPGSEHNDDWQLLSDLNKTCQSMQTRIVELIERVANEEVTNELLRVNDELNNLFLRYERHAKKHKPQPQPQPQSTAVAAPLPSRPSEPTLIDFDSTDESTVGVTTRLADIQLSGINAAASRPVEATAGDLDFDVFAQSRGASTKDNTTNDLNSVNPPPNKEMPNTVIQTQREQDFDEMEKWLKEDPTLTGSEFDRFLAERASALEKQPHKGGEGDVDVNNKPDDKSLL